MPICAKVDRHSIITQCHPETFSRAEAGMCFQTMGESTTSPPPPCPTISASAEPVNMHV